MGRPCGTTSECLQVTRVPADILQEAGRSGAALGPPVYAQHVAAFANPPLGASAGLRGWQRAVQRRHTMPGARLTVCTERGLGSGRARSRDRGSL